MTWLAGLVASIVSINIMQKLTNLAHFFGSLKTVLDEDGALPQMAAECWREVRQVAEAELRV